MDKIIKVNFEEWQDAAYVDEGLVAWNYGQILRVKGLTLPDGDVEVHFSLTDREGDANTYIGTVKDNVITIDIPNFIFQKENVFQPVYDAYAFIYQTDGETGRTIKKITFTIRVRPKPTTNVPEDNKDQFLQEVRQIMTETKEIAQSVRDDADAGKFDGKDGKDGKDGESGTSNIDEEQLLKFAIKTTTDTQPFLHITDSANYRVLDFGMEGKTEQPTTSGKNLLDPNDLGEQTINGVTFTPVYTDGILEYVLVNGTATAHAYYKYMKVSTDIINNNDVILTGGGNGCGLIFYTSEVGDWGGGKTIPKGQQPNGNISIKVSNGVTVTNVKVYPMIRLATETDATYEPFTNGASPNPEYPREIINAGVLNDETGRYEHKCCVGNKNIWNPQTDESITKVYRGWKVKPNDTTDVTVTLIDRDTSVDISGIYFGLSSEELNPNATVLSSMISNGTIKNTTLTMKSNQQYLWIYQTGDEILNRLLSRFYIMVEYGVAFSSYEEPSRQPFTLTSPVPLTKWDKLVKRDGVWGWSVFAKEYVYDGTEFDLNSNDYSSGVYMRGYVNPAIAPKNTECRCNMFRYHTSYGVVGTCGYWFADAFCMCIPNSWLEPYGYVYTPGGNNYSNAAKAFEAMLVDKGNIRIVVDMQEEQAFHPLPDEEQALLKNLETYYGVTNVYNEQGCPMWIKYVADQELHWNKKLLEIQQAMI